MSTREIAGHLCDLYGIDALPDLISMITDAVLEKVTVWQQRPLDPIPPLANVGGRASPEVIPFFTFPEEVRRIVYTTNSIEALNSKPRHSHAGPFPLRRGCN